MILDQKSCKLNVDSLPNTLWQLKKLERLSLKINNNLTNIPSQIDNLSSLTVLDLSYNKLVILPEEICTLISLTCSDLCENKLENISDKISNLINLSTFMIMNNNLKSLPKSIGKLINLEENYGLQIHSNPLISLPDSIRNVKHALRPSSLTQYESLLNDVEYRVKLRCIRRLVILNAKPAPISSNIDNDNIIDEEIIEKYFIVYYVVKELYIFIKILSGNS